MCTFSKSQEIRGCQSPHYSLSQIPTLNPALHKAQRVNYLYLSQPTACCPLSPEIVFNNTSYVWELTPVTYKYTHIHTNISDPHDTSYLWQTPVKHSPWDTGDTTIPLTGLEPGCRVCLRTEAYHSTCYKQPIERNILRHEQYVFMCLLKYSIKFKGQNLQRIYNTNTLSYTCCCKWREWIHKWICAFLL